MPVRARDWAKRRRAPASSRWRPPYRELGEARGRHCSRSSGFGVRSPRRGCAAPALASSRRPARAPRLRRSRSSRLAPEKPYATQGTGAAFAAIRPRRWRHILDNRGIPRAAGASGSEKGTEGIVKDEGLRMRLQRGDRGQIGLGRNRAGRRRMRVGRAMRGEDPGVISRSEHGYRSPRSRRANPGPGRTGRWRDCGAAKP